MDSLSSVSPSIVLPPTSDLFRPRLLRRRRRISFASLSASHNHRLRHVSSSFFGFSYSSELHRRRILEVSCNLRSGAADEEENNGEDDGREDVERAIHLDGTIPGTSDEFVKRMSSRAYDMRRHLHQTFDISSYDVLEANPWRETSKPVYVLAQRENQLCTMKTRRNHSELERELGLLFSKGGKRTSGIGNQPKQSRTGIKFQMLVEDIREGVLVFEDENEAAKYCDLLQGGGRGCEGVAEMEASSVFDLCRKMRALAVLFRRGRTPPLPQSLELNLKTKRQNFFNMYTNLYF